MTSYLNQPDKQAILPYFHVEPLIKPVSTMPVNVPMRKHTVRAGSGIRWRTGASAAQIDLAQ